MLPVEYGGTGGSLAEITEFWVTEAVKQKDWFARFFEPIVLYIYIRGVKECIHNAVIFIFGYYTVRL